MGFLLVKMWQLSHHPYQPEKTDEFSRSTPPLLLPQKDVLAFKWRIVAKKLDDTKTGEKIFNMRVLSHKIEKVSNCYAVSEI